MRSQMGHEGAPGPGEPGRAAPASRRRRMTSTLGEGVEHRQLKDWVYLKLREEIVATQLPPGYVLREAELAARFGVSKTPLREAFVRLEKDGFVQIRAVPQRGRVRLQPPGSPGD